MFFKHEWSGKCIPAPKHEPEPAVVLDLPPKKRQMKSKTEDSLALANAYDVSGLTVKHFARQTGESRGRIYSALNTRNKLLEQRGVDFDKLTSKELQSRSLGSGTKDPDDYVIPPLIENHLLDYLALHVSL